MSASEKVVSTRAPEQAAPIGLMRDNVQMPCAVVTHEFQTVITDGETAHIGSMSEPYASAFVHAVNCHDSLLSALKCALFDLDHATRHISSVTADRIKNDTIPLCRAAIAKATGGA